MCNCNQKRASFTSQKSPAQQGMVKVQRITEDPLILYGDITGRMYVFRNINDINWVDERDVFTMKLVEGLQIFHSV